MTEMRYRAVVVENEELSMSRMLRLLGEFPNEVEVVGQAMDGATAVDVIERTAPDLVFLDIDLPVMNGFEVVTQLSRQPIIVFTTAFNQHALKAFDTHAVDYLLKPIDVKAIGRSLKKLRAMVLNPLQFSNVLQKLLESDGPRPTGRIACRSGDRTVLLKTGEVLYFQADNKYTSVFTLNRELLIDTPLVDLERKLGSTEFVRIHRSTLVNLSWIAEIRRGYDGRMTVLLRDIADKELPVSRTYADNLKNL